MAVKKPELQTARSRRRLSAALGAGLLSAHSGWALGAKRTVVRMAGPQEVDDPRFAYGHRLLTLALQKAGWQVELQAEPGLTQPRQVRELELGHLDVGQLPITGLADGFQVLPVRFPLRRGLLGVRLLLARKDRLAELQGVQDLAELQRRFVLGFGADWGDLPAMRRCGFQVVTERGYLDLFRALEMGRFDFLSRAVSEVWDELNMPRLSGNRALAVVPGLALFYPLDDFFWVNPRKPELAKALERGLQLAREDGSLQRLFQSQYGRALEQAGLAQRRIFRLPGLSAPAGTPEAWFDVLDDLRPAGKAGRA
jgi:hypothetical protein